MPIENSDLPYSHIDKFTWPCYYMTCVGEGMSVYNTYYIAFPIV